MQYLLFFLLGVWSAGCVGQSEVVGSGQASVDISNELFGQAGASRGGGGSALIYEKELEQYKKYLKILGAPIAPPRWSIVLVKSIKDSIKFLGAGAFVGATVLLSDKVIGAKLSGKSWHKPAALAGVGLAAGAGITLLYQYVQLVSRLPDVLAAVNRMSDFLYDWPVHRETAPARLQEVIEPYYKQLSIDGELGLVPMHLYSLYQFVVALMNARVIELRADIVRVHAAQKKSLMMRLKESVWPF